MSVGAGGGTWPFGAPGGGGGQPFGTQPLSGSSPTPPSLLVEPWVLDNSPGPNFAGNNGPNVFAGQFWTQPSHTIIGDCFWQGWAMCLGPTGGNQYLISDGNGGDHAILFGMAPSTLSDDPDPAGHVRLSFFATDDNVGGEQVCLAQDCDFLRYGEWFHFAIGWEFGNIGACQIWINGILSGWALLSGGHNRRCGSGVASGALYLFGSDHNGWLGRLAFLQGWDTNVFAWGDPFSAWSGWRPSFVMESQRGGYFPDYAGDATKPGNMLLDVATNQLPPLDGTRYRGGPLHHGLLGAGIPGNAFIPYTEDQNAVPAGFPRPHWVKDETCPIYLPGPRTTANAYIKTPEPVPAEIAAKCLIWDSFGDRRSTAVETNRTDAVTFANDPTLGSTEAGSLGPLVWDYAPPDTANQKTYNFGVFSGNAVPIGNPAQSTPPLVNCGQGNHRVQIRRPAGCVAGDQSAYNIGMGCTFRASANRLNLWAAIIRHDTQLTLTKIVAGVPTNVVADLAFGAWDSIRVDANGDTIDVYRGNSVGSVTTWTLVVSVEDGFNDTATWVGLAVALGSYARFKNFAAVALP